MAEALRRLFGPATISTTAASPTTILATVPADQMDIVRLITAVPAVTSASGVQGQLIFGITNVTTATNWVAGMTVHGTQTTVAGANQLALALPINTGETLVAFYTDTSGGAIRKDYATLNNGSWTNSTTTDSTTLGSGAFTPLNTITVPNNIYFCVANVKAASPDTVSSISDAHDTGFSNATSIVTATSGINRASIWGGYLPQLSSASAAYTVTFGGTFTGAYVKAIVPTGGAVFHGAPATTNIVRATATATGTTETTATITTTPVSADGFQIMVISANANISYVGPTGSTEIADVALATPTNSAAAYFISPPLTNPSITLSGAGTTWAACLIEVGGSGTPTVTVSGIVID